MSQPADDPYVLTVSGAAQVHVLSGSTLTHVLVHLRAEDSTSNFLLSAAGARELAALLIADAERSERHAIEHAKLLANMKAGIHVRTRHVRTKR